MRNGKYKTNGKQKVKKNKWEIRNRKWEVKNK